MLLHFQIICAMVIMRQNGVGVSLNNGAETNNKCPREKFKEVLYKMKKFLSILLALTMIIGLLPAIGVLAANVVASGSNTADFSALGSVAFNL